MGTGILLIRHADIDTGARLCGSFDVPLSDRGRAQVQALAARRPQYAAPAALYASPLLRSREVAAALARVWHLEPRPADWAREIHCGEVDGLPLEQVRHDFPDLWARNQREMDDEFAWPGGESYRDFRARVLAGLASVAESHPGQRIAIVTHAGAITQVLGVIRDRRPAVWSEDRLDPLAAIEVVWVNGQPVDVRRFNESDWF